MLAQASPRSPAPHAGALGYWANPRLRLCFAQASSGGPESRPDQGSSHENLCSNYKKFIPVPGRARRSSPLASVVWSGWWDSHPRSLRPERSALDYWATPRLRLCFAQASSGGPELRPNRGISYENICSNCKIRFLRIALPEPVLKYFSSFLALPSPHTKIAEIIFQGR